MKLRVVAASCFLLGTLVFFFDYSGKEEQTPPVNTIVTEKINTIEETPVTDIGKTIYKHKKSENDHLKERFVSDSQKGLAVRWSYDVFTIEGDPIHHLLEFDPQNRLYNVTIDNTEDKFGKPEIRKMTCNEYSMTADLLIGCGQDKVFGLEGLPLLPMTKENGLAYLTENTRLGDKESFIGVESIDSVPFEHELTPASDYYFYKLTMKDEAFFIAVHKKTWEQRWKQTKTP